MKNSVFSTFDCDPEIMLILLQHRGNFQWILPQKTLWSTFITTKKKILSDIPKWSFSRFWDRTFQESKIFFFPRLTYSFSFLEWNSLGITMLLESSYNYFGITVKRRKNDEKFGFFDFWLWSWNNVDNIATSR